MKPPEEEVVRKIVGQWTRKAEQDFRAAEALLSQDPPLLYPSCFHSQQTAEKYLKAYVTQRQVEFPKPHNIREILELVKTVDEELAMKLLPAAALTPYTVWRLDIRETCLIPQDMMPRRRFNWPKKLPMLSGVVSRMPNESSVRGATDSVPVAMPVTEGNRIGRGSSSRRKGMGALRFAEWEPWMWGSTWCLPRSTGSASPGARGG